MGAPSVGGPGEFSCGAPSPHPTLLATPLLQLKSETTVVTHINSAHVIGFWKVMKAFYKLPRIGITYKIPNTLG